MVKITQRIAELRTERGLSAYQLAAELKLPRTAIEKFESGRQTPSQEQQRRLAAYFDVSLDYLRGETGDRESMGDWMDGAFMDVAPAAPAPAPAPRKVRRAAAEPAGGESMFDAFLNSKKFQEHLRTAVLEALRSPEGQELLAQAIRKQK